MLLVNFARRSRELNPDSCMYYIQYSRRNVDINSAYDDLPVERWETSVLVEIWRLLVRLAKAHFLETISKDHLRN